MRKRLLCKKITVKQNDIGHTIVSELSSGLEFQWDKDLHWHNNWENVELLLEPLTLVTLYELEKEDSH